MKKLGRNEPCWCGSGKKYKRCHLNDLSAKPLPFDAVILEAIRRSKHSKCYHPQASPKTCGRIVAAHTLQRARVLREIADSKNHVLSFQRSFERADRQLRPQTIGWHQASTFPAFCDKHDSEAFSPLESVPFASTKEQVFLIAYRAVCWETYQKERAIKLHECFQTSMSKNSKGMGRVFAQEALRSHEAGLRAGLKELRTLKSGLDEAFLAKDYSGLETWEVILEAPLRIASTGVVTPNRSIGGTKLQDLTDDKTRIQYLSFGTDVSEDGVCVEFMWNRGEQASRQYVEEMRKLSEQRLSSLLVQFFFAHCENTYFSSDWWQSLDRSKQEFLTKLAANHNPYYYPPPYDPSLSLGQGQVIRQR